MAAPPRPPSPPEVAPPPEAVQRFAPSARLTKDDVAPPPRAVPAKPPIPPPDPPPVEPPVDMTIQQALIHTVVAGVKGLGRGGPRHLVISRGRLAIVRAKKISASNAARMSDAQLKVADPGALVIPDDHVVALDVWECPFGGRLTLTRRHAAPVEMRWVGQANRDVEVESSLGAAFPGRVDLAVPTPKEWAHFVLPRLVGSVLAVVFVIVGGTALGHLLTDRPAPVKAAPTPTTLSANEVAVRDALGSACPAWAAMAPVPKTQLPAQDGTVRAVEAATGGFVAAAAVDPVLSDAEAELAWLGSWARRPAPEASRESLARIHYAIGAVSAACEPRP